MSARRINVLGISGFFHDASAALVQDGQVIALAAEERFTRQRHDANFPRFAAQACLEHAGLTPRDLDAVVFYEDSNVKFTRVLATLLGGFPGTCGQFARAMPRWLLDRLWIRRQISRWLHVPAERVRHVSHHLSHAYQALSACPRDAAAILTVDAVGEWTCTSIAHAQRSMRPSIKVLETVSYPQSVGLVYAAFTAFLGFRPNDGEASTMALAAFGRPVYLDQVRQVLSPEPDGAYRVTQRYFNFLSADRGLFTRAFLDLFGSPRDHRAELPFGALDDAWRSRVTPDDQRFADIAASVQRVVEEVMLGLARRALKLSGAKTLCLAGGVALNAVANTVLLQQSGCDELYIPPDPGDGGAAAGAALAEADRLRGAVTTSVAGPYLGREYAAAPLKQFVGHLDPRAWNTYRLEGSRERVASGVEMQELADWEELLEIVAEELLSGKIIGWCQGRFEAGPRALGNRSLLIDPSRVDVAQRLSQAVKKRAAFRPYALSVREEDFDQVFQWQGPPPNCAHWMQMVMPIRPESERDVRAAVHTDRTTRLQLCSRGDNPRFHDLLSAVARRRKWGAVLNTSFNEAGYPLVATPYDALITLARTDIDLLVIDNSLIRQTSAAAVAAVA